MSEHKPKIIIGLGNDTPEYQHTRHNIGFMMVDHLAEEYGAQWQHKAKLKAHLAEFRLGGQKIILAKATTMYNLTGEAARAIADFYKLNSQDILAIHDELALPFGTVRTRLQGSDAGNNGIKSLNAHLGADYARIRVGIANDHLTPSNAAHFVLQRLTHDEQASLDRIAAHVVSFVEHFIHEDKEFTHTSVKI